MPRGTHVAVKRRAMWKMIAVLVGIVGCSHTSSDVLDAGGDATNGSVLRLEWTGKPASLPATLDGATTITSATFSVANLRIVGDAGPGDPRTFVDHVGLEWVDGKVPAPIAFPAAPLGKYSRVAFNLEAEDTSPAFVIIGTVSIQGAPAVPYELSASSEIAIAFDIDVELSARADATVGVGVDLAKIVKAVDFATLPVIGGKRVLGQDDAQAPAVSAQVIDAFARQ